MSIQKNIQGEIAEVMKSKDSLRLNTLRGLLAAFTNELVATKRKPTEELADNEALEVIRRNVKQRKDSIEQFRKGGRSDLAENEEKEMEILETYLPTQMSKSEIEDIAKSKAKELGINDASKVNQLMGALMKDLKGKADGSLVKEVVSSLF